MSWHEEFPIDHVQFWYGVALVGVPLALGVAARIWWHRRRQKVTPVDALSDMLAKPMARPSRRVLLERSGIEIVLLALTEAQMRSITFGSREGAKSQINVAAELVSASWDCYPQASVDFVLRHFTAKEIRQLVDVILDVSGWEDPFGPGFDDRLDTWLAEVLG